MALRVIHGLGACVEAAELLEDGVFAAEAEADAPTSIVAIRIDVTVLDRDGITLDSC